MKYCLFFLFTIVACAAQAQTLPVVHKNEPVYFLDSIKYSRPPVFDAGTLESVSVLKDNPAYPNGAVFMTSKAGTRYHFMSLEELAQKYAGDTKSYMIMIDNDFIKNMSGFLIDSAYVLKCETMSTRDFVHLQHLPEIKILKVTTANKDNIEKWKKIIIRG